MNRREFLKLSGTVFVEATAVSFLGKEALDHINNDGAKLTKDFGVDVLRDELATDICLNIAISVYIQKAQDRAKESGIVLEANPKRRMLKDILQEGIERYATTGRPVFFDRSEEDVYISDEILENALNDLNSDSVPNITAKEIVSYLSGNSDVKISNYLRDIRHKFYGGDKYFFSKKLVDELSYAGFDIRSWSWAWYLYKNSGIVFRSLSNTEIPKPDADQFDFDSFEKFASTAVGNEVGEAINYLKQKSEEEKGPVSASYLLTHFLEKSNGNIGQSIEDTSLILQLMSRNDLKTATYIVDPTDYQDGGFTVEKMREKVCDRMNLLIKDEYIPLGNGDFGKTNKKDGVVYDFGTTDYKGNKDLSRINLVGAAYHTWGLLMLLRFASPQTIRFMDIGANAFEINSAQGFLKVATDFSALAQLNEVLKYLERFN